jgi:hypothetical protein
MQVRVAWAASEAAQQCSINAHAAAFEVDSRVVAALKKAEVIAKSAAAAAGAVSSMTQMRVTEVAAAQSAAVALEAAGEGQGMAKRAELASALAMAVCVVRYIHAWCGML